MRLMRKNFDTEKNHENMAILESCCGCGLAVSSAVLGVYLLVAYAIAFAIELWWILESPVARPIPSYLLCFGYFILITFSALLLQGLSVKRTTFLLVWLFMMGILLGPEAGLVLYLSIHYWRVTSMHGIIEVTCWGCRLVVNAISLLCVQSLHSIWREEKSVLLRLETLKTKSPAAEVQEGKLNVASVFRGHKKKGFEQKHTGCKGAQGEVDFRGLGHFPQNGGFLKNEDEDGNYFHASYSEGNEFSEFNASSFDPTVIDAHLLNLPYLTIRKTPRQLNKQSILNFGDENSLHKTRSLLDFGEPETEILKAEVSIEPHKPKNSQNSANSIKAESKSGSLDRKIIKNKNLKILNRFSPFYNRKPTQVNIYRINPPKDLAVSDLDSRLNKVYSNRGKYVFDEKGKKVVFYPPEFFRGSLKFRKRIDSYGSNQSRSSMDTDSEDIRHISDVAL